MKRVFLCTVVIFLFIAFSPTYSSEPISTQKISSLHFEKTTEIHPYSKTESQLQISGSCDLVKMINVHHLYEAGPINLTIQSIKMIQVTPFDLKKSPYKAIIIDWDMLNSAEEDFFFTPITEIEMSNGERFNNAYRSTPNVIEGWETKSGITEFIIKPEQNLNLLQFTIHTSDIQNVNKRKLVDDMKITLKQ